MTTYAWTTLPSGTVINPFDPNADVFNFDDLTISAAEVGIAFTLSAPFSVTFSNSGKSIVLRVDFNALTGDVGGNVTFADGSMLLVGDNTTGTANDSLGNTLTGGTGDDQIWGLAGNDILSGGDGNDFIVGGLDSDTLDGGPGIDTISYADTPGVVWANFSPATVNISSAGFIIPLAPNKVQHGPINGANGQVPYEDTATNTEIYIGGNSTDLFWGHDTVGDIVHSGTGNDLLRGGGTGDTSADQLFGEGGNDVLRPTRGGDLIDGGIGSDTMDFSQTGIVYTGATAVNVNLFGQVANIGTGAFDTIVRDIEVVIGTAGNDVFQAGDPLHGPDSFGNPTAETFQPGAGNDTVSGLGQFGRELILDYSTNSAAQALRANLGPNSHTANSVTVAGNTALDGLGGTDTLSFVQTLRGGAADDTLFGGGPTRSQQGSFLETFRGNGGNDYIDGLGATALPNPSRDGFATRADYSTSTNPVFVNFGSAPLLIAAQTLNSGEAFDGIGAANGGLGGRDTLRNISQVFGGNGGDLFVNGIDGEIFNGGAGNDTINGNGFRTETRYQTATAFVIVNLTASSVIAGGFTVASNTARDGQGGTDTLIGVTDVRGSDFNDFLFGGNGDERFSGDSGNDIVDGGAGIDYMRYNDVPVILGGVTAFIDNGSGFVANDGYGTTDTLSNIEGLIGTQRNDTLGGGAGDQHFFGRGGSDDLSGGPGSDWAHYSTDPGGVIVNLTAGTANDGWAGPGNIFGFGGTDDLLSIENAEGSVFNDTLVGEAGVNTLLGIAGDDTIEGRAGDDILNGGDGNDRLEGGIGADSLIGGNGFDYAKYRYAGAGVVADLSGAMPGSGDAMGDTFTTIEGVIGSLFNDTLYGDGNANDLAGLDGQDGLSGGGGNDNLQGGVGDDFMEGGSGGDFLNGGAGFDTAAYHHSSGVTASLSTPAHNTGEAAGDFYLSVEGIFGSGFADTLIGDGAANLLIGLFGDDTIEGRDGADLLQGGDGSDRLEGGAGADSLDGGADLAFDYAKYRYAGSSVVADLAGLETPFGDAVGDTFININGLIGSQFADLLYGDGLQNDIAGLDGDDNLFGRGGDDNLQGGNGNDTLDGGANDPLGPKDDRMVGGAGDDNFDFHYSEANGDEVFDFQGITGGGADKLRFFGYGPNPTFSFVDATHYSITPDPMVGGPAETIEFTNAAIVVQAFDVQFFP